MFDLIKIQLADGILFYPAILVLIMIFVYLSFRIVRSLFPRPSKTTEKEFEELLDDAGYGYDQSQDIFYSKMDAWQRKLGYCRLYDEAAAPAGMIIDSEPIRFEYGGKRWLIELWKGQYCLSSGCEIGVYYTEDPDIEIPNLFSGTFYQCVDNANRLEMAYKLYKNGRELFYREAKHWWLTGFKLGEFSEPRELVMSIRITFKDTNMCRSFIRAMQKVGYQEDEINTNGIIVEFLFDKTHTTQPLTRSEETDWIIQRSNELLCDRFRDITGEYATWTERLRAIKQDGPLYEALINFGKTRNIFKAFDKLRSFI